MKLEFGIDYVIADGVPLSVSIAKGAGGADAENKSGELAMTFTETWRGTDGTSHTKKVITNCIPSPLLEGTTLANTILFVESLAKEMDSALAQYKGINHEQAAVMGMCHAPSAVAEFLEGIQYGRAASVMAGMYPLISQNFASDSSISPKDQAVPVYHTDFLDLFRGTSIHSSLIVSNFLTKEVNKLRIFCCQNMDNPRGVLKYCKDLRLKIQLLRSKIEESAHIASVFAQLERHEIERAENCFQHRLDEQVLLEQGHDPLYRHS